MNYIDKKELLDSMLESQKLGHPTDKYALQCQAIATHMLGGRQFRKYSYHLKEDLASHAILCCMKALRSFDSSKTDNAFGYLTRTCYTAFLQVLKQHYKQMNIQRELMERAMAQMDQLSSKDTLKRWEDQEWEGSSYGSND